MCDSMIIEISFSAFYVVFRARYSTIEYQYFFVKITSVVRAKPKFLVCLRAAILLVVETAVLSHDYSLLAYAISNFLLLVLAFMLERAVTSLKKCEFY